MECATEIAVTSYCVSRGKATVGRPGRVVVGKGPGEVRIGEDEVHGDQRCAAAGGGQEHRGTRCIVGPAHHRDGRLTLVFVRRAEAAQGAAPRVPAKGGADAVGEVQEGEVAMRSMPPRTEALIGLVLIVISIMALPRVLPANMHWLQDAGTLVGGMILADAVFRHFVQRWVMRKFVKRP